MTPDQAIRAYRQALAVGGERIVLRRIVGTTRQIFLDAEVTARVVAAGSGDGPPGETRQDGYTLIVLADDLARARWPVPPRQDDKAIVRGRQLNVEFVDDSTRRIGAVAIAYELTARG